MYLAKLLLLSTTIAMIDALPYDGGGGPTGNNSEEAQCQEDLQGLDTALNNVSAAQAAVDAANNPAQSATNAINVILLAQATAALAAARMEAAAYAAGLNDMDCAQFR